MFSLEPGLTVWTIIVFLFFLFVLSKYAWKPLLKALQDREHSIADALGKAETARHEAERLLKENAENRQRAEEEYKRIVGEARRDAERRAEDILKKAEEQSFKNRQTAQEEIARSLEQAKLTLRDEIAHIAIGAAEKILRETIDQKKNQKLVEDFLGDIKKN